jgi:peptide/nickel transport system permease protein
MIGYAAQRLAAIVAIVVIMSFVIFAVTQILPGDVAHTILGQFATDEQIRALQHSLGLNDPWYQQYGRWAVGVLHGDLGRSLIMQRPIGPEIAAALGRSAMLALPAFALVVVVGLSLGIHSATHLGKASDHALSMAQYLFIAVPEFFWAIIAILLFSRYLGWLPATGYAPLSEGFLPWLSHMVLPVATLVCGLIAHVSRLTRSGMIEALQSTYIVAARGRGLSRREVLWRHALPNAILPTITVLAIDVGILIGGIVVVETVFAYPGLGRMLVFAVEQRDLPLLQAGVLVVTAIYGMANLTADLLYGYFNPRIRFGRQVA